MEIHENMVYSPEAGEYGIGDLWLPDDLSAHTPLALVIHGGAWVSLSKSRMTGICGFLCEKLKFAAFNINYRLADLHKWPACGDDCLKAARFLLEGDIPSLAAVQRKNILLIGGSAGGHLALMTGLRLPREKVGGIVSISGIDSLREDHALAPQRYRTLLGHEPSEAELKAVDPVTYLSPDAPPILCTHDKLDNVVPCESAEHFVAEALKLGADCSVYYTRREEEGISHRIWQPGTRNLYPDIEEHIADWVKKYF